MFRITETKTVTTDITPKKNDIITFEEGAGVLKDYTFHTFTETNPRYGWDSKFDERALLCTNDKGDVPAGGSRWKVMLQREVRAINGRMVD